MEKQRYSQPVVTIHYIDNDGEEQEHQKMLNEEDLDLDDVVAFMSYELGNVDINNESFRLLNISLTTVELPIREPALKLSPNFIRGYLEQQGVDFADSDEALIDYVEKIINTESVTTTILDEVTYWAEPDGVAA